MARFYRDEFIGGFGFYERGAKLWVDKMIDRAIKRMHPDYWLEKRKYAKKYKTRWSKLQANRKYYDENKEMIKAKQARYRERKRENQKIGMNRPVQFQ